MEDHKRRARHSGPADRLGLECGDGWPASGTVRKCVGGQSGPIPHPLAVTQVGLYRGHCHLLLLTPTEVANIQGRP